MHLKQERKDLKQTMKYSVLRLKTKVFRKKITSIL